MMKIGLQFFADDGISAMPDSGAENVDTATAEQPEKVSFDDLLKDADYKKAYDTRVDKAIKDRFKKTESERRKLDPMFEALGRKYGLDTSDMKKFDMNALTDKVLADDELFEQEASEKGMTVDGLRKVKEAERMVAEHQQMEQEEADQRNFNAILEESKALKEQYPAFDLDAEFADKMFVAQVRFLQESGAQNPLKTVYEQRHLNDIIGSGMQFVAQKTKQQMSQSIQSGMSRPKENGAGVPSKSEFDPRNLTREQREDIRRRVARGERIEF